MATQATAQTVEVPAHSGEESVNVMQITPTMMGLTWITFLLMTFILYKVAWKPILAGLEKREQLIRKSLEEAAKAREELARLEETRKQMMAESDRKAKEILETANASAARAAEVIEKKAHDEAQLLVANAQREIQSATEKARAALRKESADLAVGLAGKIIGQNLDDAKNRELTERLLKDL